MKPVMQTIVRANQEFLIVPGDSLRAGVASMFELNILQVPHFLLFGKRWYSMLYSFLWAIGYKLEYYTSIDREEFSRKHLINGCILASVKSKTFKNGTHCVLVNSKGRVLHDPNPNQWYKDINIIETKDIVGWHVIRKRNIK